MKNRIDGVYNRYIKRGLDLTLVILLAIPAGLVVVFCAIAIRLEGKGPVFFVQERPGRRGQVFRLYKLRTMCPEIWRNGRELTDMERMTKVGAVLRRYSLDEIPQLLNVLRGEMSFVGTRPLLMQYMGLYTPEQMRRHEVRPGLSGWAQVHGRNRLSWEEKFRMDNWYVDHVSFGVDAKILGMTIKTVLAHRDINAGERETMGKFSGSGQEMLQG